MNNAALIFSQHGHRLCAFLFCILPLFLETGCASSLILNPDAARKALRFQPVIAEYPTKPQTIEVINQTGRRLKGLLFSKTGDQGIVLVGGGNAMGLEHTAHYASFLLGHGFRVLVYSYQGYDDNAGPASIDSLVPDAMAFYAYAKHNFPNDNVVLFGTSISAVTSVCLAQSLSPPPSMVVEAIIDPKTIIYYISQKHWPLFLLGYPLAWVTAMGISDSIDPAKCIGSLGASSKPPPINFIFSPTDKLAPYSTIKELIASYQGPKSSLISSCNLTGNCHMNLYCDRRARSSIVHIVKNAVHQTIP